MKILLATDGSEHAMKAMEKAKWLAGLDPNIHVLVLYVLPRPITIGQAMRAGVGFRYKDYEDEFVRIGEEVLERTTKALDLPPERMSTLVTIGVPAEEICRIAEEEQVGMIIMGSRGENPVESLLLGSTSHKVLQLAPCPVLLVR